MKVDESAFNLHTGMIALKVQHKIMMEIDTPLLGVDSVAVQPLFIQRKR